MKEALPERAQALAGPSPARAEFRARGPLAHHAVRQFQKLWVDANRIAHAQLVTSSPGRFSHHCYDNGAVQIDLSSLTQLVGERLQSTGIDLLSKIPIAEVGGQITLFQSNDLYKVRKAVGILNTLAWVLPLVVFAAFGGAIFLSAHRRRAFVQAADRVHARCALALFVPVPARGMYLNAATNTGFPSTRRPRCTTPSSASCTPRFVTCSRSASSW